MARPCLSIQMERTKVMHAILELAWVCLRRAIYGLAGIDMQPWSTQELQLDRPSMKGGCAACHQPVAQHPLAGLPGKTSVLWSCHAAA